MSLNDIKKWGNATWFLFHTLAIKLKDEKKLVNDLLHKIIDICHNLPCPTCREHAVKTIKNSDINKIITKKDLIQYIFSFHNIVNKKLKKKIFDFKEHEDLFKRAKTINIINHWIAIMLQNVNNEKGMTDTYNRQVCVRRVIKFLKENLQHFNL